MKKSKKQTILGVGILAGFVILWSIVFYLYKPQELISDIGITNSYWITFLVALIGAFTSFTTISIYPLLIILAAGGAGAMALGAVAGAGLTIGDMIFFFFGIKVSGLTSERFRKKLHNVLDQINKQYSWLMPLIIYLYVGFTPFPNNLLTGYLALVNYPWTRLIAPLALGNISLPIIAAYMAPYIIHWFR